MLGRAFSRCHQTEVPSRRERHQAPEVTVFERDPLATAVGDEAAAEDLIDRLRGLIEPTIEHPTAGPLHVSATAGACLLPPLRDLESAADTHGRLLTKDEWAKDALDGYLKLADQQMSRRKDRTGRRRGH